MARVFWVVNKVESSAHWTSGQAGQDWRSLLEDLFRLRPPTEVTLPAPAPAIAAANRSTPATETGEETEERERSEEATGDSREGSRSRNESVSLPLPSAQAVASWLNFASPGGVRQGTWERQQEGLCPREVEFRREAQENCLLSESHHFLGGADVRRWRRRGEGCAGATLANVLSAAAAVE